MKPIELTDVGPIEKLTIPLPDRGGVVLLVGRNGSGKSIAINAVQTLVEGSGKVPSRDGSLGAQVSGCGVRVTFGRRAAASGELEVEHLDGEDPSVLVDPGIKDGAAADQARIRALLRLSRATVGPEAFAPLVGGDEALREMCPPAALEMTSDVPGMTAAIKRAIESAARKAEQTAENLGAKAAGMRATLDGMGGGPVVELVTGSAEAARESHTKRVAELAALKATREQSARLKRAANDARTQLAALGDDGTETAIADAQAAQSDAATWVTHGEQLVADADAEIHRIEVELERARGAKREAAAELARRKSDAQEAEAATKRQQRAAEQRAALERASKDADNLPDATDAALTAAEQAVQDASAEIERWAVRERTAKVRNEVADLEQQARAAAESGIELRNAARGTERVLLERLASVCPEGMELSDGRLYMKTDRGVGRELFAELSAGERWRIAIDIAVAAVGSNGLITCKQESWEGLDPENRRAIAEHCKARGVVLITAQADDGAIRAEIFEPERAAS